MKYTAILLFGFLLCGTSISAGESASILVKIGKGHDGSEVRAGVVIEGEGASTTHWTSSVESQFSIEVPDTHLDGTLLFLKKNALPVVRPMSSELIEKGISVEFVEGESIVGSVAAKKDGVPITEGSMSVMFDENEYKLSMLLSDWYTWEIEDDGSFEIRGIPLGEHVVSAAAPGYMPAIKSVLVTADDQEIEIDFLLPKAESVTGHMEVYVERKRVIGEIDVVVSPTESQTVEFITEFDEEKRFHIGPFAEDAELELVASLPNGQRSSPKKITVPIEDDITLWLYDWVRIYGTVQDQETGEPVPEFSLVINNFNPMYEVADPNGQFSEEIYNAIASVSIDAPGYVFYMVGGMGNNLRDVEKFNFGTIELERAFTVRGRVLASPTREPIEGARIVKYLNVDDDINDFDIMTWNYSNKTTTDADGEFELNGFKDKGEKIMAGAKGYATDVLTIEDVELPLEIELNPLGSISGKVVTLAGEPVTAQIHYPGGSTRADDGNFHFNVEEGVHRYRAVADSGRSQVVE